MQAFTYDIRTAILPFMFIFNTDILLWQINSFWQAILIFLMTTVGCFCFAGATQRWFVARARWYEIILLLCVTAIMFRPYFFSGLIGMPGNYGAYGLGLVLFSVLIALQWPRRPKLAPAA